MDHERHKGAKTQFSLLARKGAWVLLAVAFLLLAGAPVAADKWGEGAVHTPVPAIYQFLDFEATDHQKLHPEYGPIGSVFFVTWEQINPGPGRFDWSLLDARLAREAALTVTLTSGEVVSKPVMVSVIFFLAENEYWPCSNTYFWDGTPAWVYDQIDRLNPGNPRPVVCGRKVGHLLEGCGFRAAVPMYDNATWRDYYFQMVRAFGERYRDNHQISAVLINTGIDGETHLVKNTGCNWGEISDQQASGVQYHFQRFMSDSMRVFREAFPNTTVWIQNAAGGPGVFKNTSDLAATIVPQVGIKNNSGWVDHNNHEGWGAEIGRWDMYRVYSQTLPIWIESVHGMGAPELRYWAWLAMLHYHPDGIDTHPEFITQSDPEWLRFVQEHLGRSLANTPDVWCALRDYEFPLITWGGAAGQSGHMGDWTFWLTRTSDNPRVWRADMPAEAQDSIYARQARRVDPAHPLTVQVDPRVWFAGRPAEVRVLAYGTLAIDGQPGEAVDAGDGWTETTWQVEAADMITLQGSAYVHRVLVEPKDASSAGETATPAPTETPIATETPTLTATATAPVEPSATTTTAATVAPTATAGPTATPTPTPEPGAGTPAGIALAVVDIVIMAAPFVWAIYRWLRRDNG